MKTLKELNLKWWYRLLKVVYTVSFLIFISIVFWVSWDKTTPKKIVDNDKTLLVCDSGKTYTSKQLKFDFANSSLGTFLKNQEFNQLCGYKNIDNQNKFSDWESFNAQYEKHYKIDFKYKKVGNRTITVIYFGISLLLFVIGFEIFRRLFYYVVLGSLRPKK